MKRSGIIFSLLFIIVFGLIAQVSMAQKTGDVEEVVTIDLLPPNSIYKQIWQPFIAMWKTNYYVVAYGLKLDGKSDIGDIVCSITKDGGNKVEKFDQSRSFHVKNHDRIIKGQKFIDEFFGDFTLGQACPDPPAVLNGKIRIQVPCVP